MYEVKLNINKKEWEEMAKRLKPSQIYAAGRQALKRTARYGITQASRRIKDKMAWPKTVRKPIGKIKKQFRPDFTAIKRLESKIIAFGRGGIPVIDPDLIYSEFLDRPYWIGTQLKKGVKANVAGVYRSYLHSWIMPQKARGRGKAYRRVGKSRYPIRQIKSGPTIPDLFEDVLNEGLRDELADKLNERMNHEINRRLKRRR